MKTYDLKDTHRGRASFWHNVREVLRRWLDRERELMALRNAVGMMSEARRADAAEYHEIVELNRSMRDDARRLVACWNACEGLDTDLLENIVMTGDTIKSRFDLRAKDEREMVAERDALRAVNAELVEALKEWLYRQGTDENYMVAKARAALAKAKELKGTE